MAGPYSTFSYCDPQVSFASDSLGSKRRRMQGRHGEVLGAEAWEIGSKAYARILTEGGASPAKADLLEFMTRQQPELDAFFEALNERALAGSLKLQDEYGNAHALIDWREGDWAWQVKTMIAIVQAIPTLSDDSIVETYAPDMLVAALVSLDNAALSSFCDDADTAAACVLDAAWLVGQVELLAHGEERAQVLLKQLDRSRASDRARLRHAKDPKRKAKEFVFECWVAWRQAPASYASASAFARAMLDKLPEELTSEVVVTRWVRQWDREAKPSLSK